MSEFQGSGLETPEDVFRYMDDLVARMHKVVQEHEDLTTEYSLGLEYIRDQGWGVEWNSKLLGDDGK